MELGISVYLSEINLEYLKLAKENDARTVFTSLHIPEEKLDDLDDKLDVFLNECERLDLNIIPDISPYTFEKLGLDNRDFKGLQAMGFKTVRLDFGFERPEDVKEILHYFDVVMNASMIDEAVILEMKAEGVDLQRLILMHNFYPRQDTGLDEKYFRKLNEVHQRYQLKTMAFVPGDLKKRLPFYEGLPTLEKHRDQNPYVSCVELMLNYGIQSVLIGDPEAKTSTLQFMHDFISNGILTIPVHLSPEYHYLYDKITEIRKDASEALIRLAEPRKADIEIFKNNHRRKGSIVIENRFSGRYSGEIQIIRQDLPFVSRTNNIGFVHPDYIGLLVYADYPFKLKFVKI